MQPMHQTWQNICRIGFLWLFLNKQAGLKVKRSPNVKCSSNIKARGAQSIRCTLACRLIDEWLDCWRLSPELGHRAPGQADGDRLTESLQRLRAFGSSSLHLKRTILRSRSRVKGLVLSFPNSYTSLLVALNSWERVSCSHTTLVSIPSWNWETLSRVQKTGFTGICCPFGVCYIITLFN